jgi:gluconokinase
MTHGMMGFARVLDKIRLHARGELAEDYHQNFGRQDRLDGACCNFLRVHHRDLRTRVLQGGSDEEILQWCFEQGRELNVGDLVVWNGFVSKLGWNDFASPLLAQGKAALGIADRDDIATVPDLMDFEEGRTGS